MNVAYNQRNPAVKRLMREAVELKEPSELYFAQPLEDNLFEWHFTVRGPSDTDFSGGIYHGRIILPPEYPMKPPSIMLLTPNGRFELNKKICLSISGYHPESWQPSWSIRTALLAIIGFMPTPGAGALGALDYTSEERQVLAKKSVSWKCSTCNVQMSEILLPLTDASLNSRDEAKQLASQISFKGSTTKGDENSADSQLQVTRDLSVPSSSSLAVLSGVPDTVTRSVDTVTRSEDTVTRSVDTVTRSMDTVTRSMVATPSSASMKASDSTLSFNELNSRVSDLAEVQHGVMAVRQRLLDRVPPVQLSPAPSVSTTNQSRAGSPTIACVIWLAAIMIAVLLFRRLYLLTERNHDGLYDDLN